MIFYTLQGPSHQLEIHDDKILLITKGWRRLLSRKPTETAWPIKELAHFEITVPQYILHGKVEWRTFDGSSGSFRFSTHPVMMKKIELYMQKCVIKNHHRIRGLKPISKDHQRSQKLRLHQVAA